MKIDRSRKSGSILEGWVRSFRLKCQNPDPFRAPICMVTTHVMALSEDYLKIETFLFLNWPGV